MPIVSIVPIYRIRLPVFTFSIAFCRFTTCRGDTRPARGSKLTLLSKRCRLITYWPARSIFISGAEEIRDAHRPSIQAFRQNGRRISSVKFTTYRHRFARAAPAPRAKRNDSKNRGRASPVKPDAVWPTAAKRQPRARSALRSSEAAAPQGIEWAATPGKEGFGSFETLTVCKTLQG